MTLSENEAGILTTTTGGSSKNRILSFLHQNDLSTARLLEGLERKSLYFRRVNVTHEFCHNLDLFLQSSSWQSAELDAVTGQVGRLLSILLSASSPVLELNFCSMNNQSMDLYAWGSLGRGLRRNILHSLTLSWTEIPSEGMRRLADGLKDALRLEVLEFSCTTWTNRHVPNGYEENVSNASLSTQSDSDSHCDDDYQSAYYLSQSLKKILSLKELILNGSNIADPSAALIVGALVNHSALQKMWLSMNKCGEATSAALSEMLRHPNCALQALYLDGQRFPRGGRCRRGETKLNMSVLSAALRANRSLNVLDLTDNHYLQDQELELLGHCLSFCDDTSSSSPSSPSSVSVNTTLQTLQLARNGITSRGLANFLCNILPGIHGLKTISLGGNVMEDLHVDKLQGNNLHHVNNDNNNPMNHRILRAMIMLEDVELLKAVAAPEQLPPALWPKILYHLQKKHQVAKTRRKTSSQHVDLLYLFVRGPMLMSPLQRNAWV